MKLIDAEFPLVQAGDIISFDLELRVSKDRFTIQVWSGVEVYSSAVDDPIGTFRCQVPSWLAADCGFRRGLCDESLIYFCDVREVRFADGRVWVRDKSLRNQRVRSRNQSEANSSNSLSRDVRRVEVAGSKGGKYIVELGADWVQCNCVGFGWRGHCRHVDLALKEIKES